MLNKLNFKWENGDITFLKVFLFLSPFLFGGFHIGISSLFTIILGIYIIIKGVKSSFSSLEVNLTLIYAFLFPTFYLVTSFWAVDGGTAIYGFIKFIPIALFSVCICGLTSEQKEELLGVVPTSAAVMGVLSLLLSIIPKCAEYIMVADRLGGFFQYPNTYAVYCLVGFAVSLMSKKLTIKNWILAIMLLAFILLTGSRTVFVLLCVVGLFLFIKVNKKNKLWLLVVFLGVGAVGAIVIFATDSVQTVGRFLTISKNSSTLLGRLLYYKDALPVILHHPFGLGYYGYYFMQGSFQTGVYSVAGIHNELLQIMLDIGWVPAIFSVVIGFKALFSKNTSLLQKLVLVLIVLHSLFDFDLQFLSLWFVLLLTLDFETKPYFELDANQKIFSSAVMIPVILVSIYFGIINGMFLTGNYQGVDNFYGRDTQSKIKIITQMDDYNKMVKIADDVIRENKYVAIAYDTEANYYFEKGKIKNYMAYKDKAIKCSPYVLDEYTDYLNKLSYLISEYSRLGQNESASICIDKYIEVVDSIQKTIDKTDELAWKIKDKPELELEDKYIEIYDSLVANKK